MTHTKTTISLALCIILPYGQRSVQGSFLVHESQSFGVKQIHYGMKSKVLVNHHANRRVPPSLNILRVHNNDDSQEEEESSISSSTTKRVQTFSDFAQGFRHVNDNYLDILWKYSFRKTTDILLPLVSFLLLAQYFYPQLGYAMFQLLNQTLGAACSLASLVSRCLLFPLVLVEYVWKQAPTFVVPILDLMPKPMIWYFVSFVLYVQRRFHILIRTPFLSSLAVVFWWPTLEEFQFRFLMNKIIGEERLGTSSSLGIEKAKQDDETPTLVKVSSEQSTTSNERLLLSRSYLVSTFLFAATRLGWLCAHPDDVTRPTPYSWTVGFMQSILALFSTNVLSDLRPRFQMCLTIFALHQCISTYLVGLHIFVPFYKTGGLPASIGAHLAWTLGKITIPFRATRRFLQWRAKQLERE